MPTLYAAFIDGRESASLTRDELLQLAHDGRILADTPIRRQSETKWYRASQVQGLTPYLSLDGSIGKANERAAEHGNGADSVPANQPEDLDNSVWATESVEDTDQASVWNTEFIDDAKQAKARSRITLPVGIVGALFVLGLLGNLVPQPVSRQKNHDSPTVSRTSEALGSNSTPSTTPPFHLRDTSTDTATRRQVRDTLRDMESRVPDTLRDMESRVPGVMADIERQMMRDAEKYGLSPSDVRNQMRELESGTRQQIRGMEPDVRRQIRLMEDDVVREIERSKR